MAKMSLREWINSQQKAKGVSTSEAKKDASKYKSISAAKKAGSLYYTDKSGKTKIAAYASDLTKADKPTAPKKSLRPKARPASDVSGVKIEPVEVKNLVKGGRGDGRSEVMKRKIDIESPTSRQRRNEEVKAGSKTLADMRASGLRAPKLSPRGKAATAKIKGAVTEELAAMASRAKRYTKERWQNMSRAERIKLGLPPSFKEVAKGNVLFKGQNKTRRGTR